MVSHEKGFTKSLVGGGHPLADSHPSLVFFAHENFDPREWARDWSHVHPCYSIHPLLQLVSYSALPKQDLEPHFY